MSVNNSEYELTVKTTLDDQGLKKTADGLSEVGKEAEHANEPLKDIGKTHEDIGQKAHEAGKKELEVTEKTTLGHREKREALRAVLAQFGGFADVGLLLEPELAALAASLAAVEALRGLIEQASAAQEKLNAAARAFDAAQLKTAADAASELASAITEAAIAEERLDQAYATGTAAMDARIKKYGEEKDAILAIDQAKEAAFEAEIKRREKLGLISPQQGDAAIESSKLGLDAERGATDQDKLKETITERSKALKDAQDRLSSGKDQNAIAFDESAVKETGKELVTAKNKLDKSGKDIEVSSPDFKTKHFADMDALQKAAHEAQEKMDRTAATPNSSGTQEEATYIASAAAEQKKLVDLLNEEIQKRQQAIALAQADVNDAKSENTEALSRRNAAIDQSKKDKDLIRTEPDNIKSLQDQYDIQQRRNDQVHSANRQAAQSRLAASGASLPGTPAPPPANPVDTAAQNQWSQTSNDRGQIGIDIVEGHRALGELQIRHGQRRPVGQEELQNLLNEFIGLAKDIHGSAAQHSDLARLKSQVEELRREVGYHEQRLAQSSNVF